MRILILSLFFSLSTAMPAQAQREVPVLNFEELLPLLSRDNDTTYVVNFWATWCKPCVAELPYFEELHAKYADSKVKVLLVSLDFKRQLDSKVIPFLDKNKIRSQVLLLDARDPNAWIDRVDPSWSGAIPATLFYRGDRRVFIEDSFEDLHSLDSIVQPLLKS